MLRYADGTVFVLFSKNSGVDETSPDFVLSGVLDTEYWVLRRGVNGFNKLGLGSTTVRKIGLFCSTDSLRTGNFCIDTFDFGLLLTTRNGGNVLPSNNTFVGFLDLVDGFKFIQHILRKDKELKFRQR